MKLAHAGLILLLAAPLSGCTKLSAWITGRAEHPSAVVLQDHIAAEWLSLSSAQKVAAQGTIPYHWDASVFVSKSLLERLSQGFEGLTLEDRAWTGVLAGSTVRVTKFELTPATGVLEATISLHGMSSKLNLGLDLQVDAIARYVGTASKNGHNLARAQFKWFPLEVRPGADWKGMSFAANGFAAKLLAQTAEYFSRSDTFVFSVPVQRQLSADIGLAKPREATISIPSTNGSINMSESMPQVHVTAGLVSVTPVFTDYGIWILSSLSDGSSEPSPPTQIPTASVDELQKQILAMRKDLLPKLAGANPGPVDISAFVNRTAFERLITDIAVIPQGSRILQLQVINHQGRLAEKVLHDDVLGNLEAFAEIASDRGTHATVSVGNISGSWSSGGMRALIPISAHLDGSIHFHVRPPITGGVGTVVGILGDAAHTLSLSARPLLLSKNGASVAALAIQPQCDNVSVTATTDGVLKVDFGWMSVPKVGVKIGVPVFNRYVAPTDIFDSRPHFLSFLPEDSGDIHFSHPAPYDKLILTPIAVTPTDQGLRVDANVTLSPLPEPPTPEGAKEARAEVQKEAAAIKDQVSAILAAASAPSQCPPVEPPELIVGNILIGPNNEIVKFLVNSVNDFTKGPSDSNDAVKAGYYVGSVLKKLNPADPVVQSFLSNSDAAAKSAFGENSVAYSAVARVDQEAKNVLDNPVKATMDLPANTIQAIQGFGNAVAGVGQALTHPSVSVGLDHANVKVGNNGVSVGNGKANVTVAGVCIGFGC